MTNSHGAVTSGVARVTVRPAIALAEALDTPAWEWRTDGIAPWFGQGDQARDGVDAARAGMNLRAFESSWIESTVAGPARLSFWWRLDGSAGDELAVDVGFATRHVLRGTTPWQNQSIEIPSGSHRVRWVYRKDSGAGAITDGAWLDEVRVVPVAPSIQTPPRSTTNCLGTIAMFTVTAVGTPPLQYQWLLHGAEILGANGASLVITNLVPGLAGDYSVRVTNPAGAVESPRARLVLKSGRTMELAEALDWAGPAPRSGPLNAWYGQDCESYDSIDAARSAPIAHGSVSSMELDVAGPGTLQFWWRVSSESSDYAEVRVDGQMRMRVSGERGWESRSLSVEEGTHRIEWRYVKDGAVSGGQDAAWVDQVRFLPAPLRVIGPEDVTVCVGESVMLSAEISGSPPLRTRWQRNRVDIPGATGTELRLTPVSVADAAVYRLVVSNAVETVVSREAHVRVIECVPLPEALDATELTWTTSPTRPWHGQTIVTHDGVDAAQSGAIGNSEQSWIETSVEGPGLLNFWWRASSEQCCDKLRLFVNGIEVAVAPQQWEQQARSLPAGPVSLRWVYSKDFSFSSGADAAWVDRVTFRPQHTAPEIVTQPPERVTVCSGGTLELAVEAVGRVPIEYEWRKDGVLLTSSGSVLRLESVVTGHAGVYTVRISNALGTTDSRPSLVTVVGDDGITLAEALDAPDLEFETSGSPPWRGQSCVTHDGVDAAASVRAPPSSQGWIETRVQGPGHLGFWWRVLGDYSDRLVLRTNNVTALTLRGDVREWQRAGIGLAPGEQVIRWTYERAGSTANDDTGAWLDEVELATVPMLPQVNEEPPARVAACAGTRVELAVTADGTAPLTYRWHHNGIPIEGATSRTWAVDQAVPSHSGVYEVHISNALGEVRSRATLVEILPSDGIPLSEALDTGLTLVQRGAAAWVGQACVTHDGIDAARSGAIGHRQESSMETTIEGPGLLGFWWMADSETGWDKLEFLVEDRVVRAAPQRSWQWVTHDLGTGTYRVRWRYTKDGSGSFGADAGYVDQLVFVRYAGPPVLAAEPHAVSTCEGARAEFSVVAGGQPPLDYQWTRNGVPLIGQNEPTLVLTNVTASVAGVYVVTVANALGVVTSAPAILRVFGDAGIDLETALDAPDLEFTTHPVRPWVGGACVSHDGVDAAHTVDLPIDQASWIETRLVGPGYLSFWWRVEGHTFDEVGVSLNGTTRSTLRPQAGRWTRGVLSVPDGTNTVRWTHRRWTFSTSASGRAWLDEVEYRPSRVPARIIEQPRANLAACIGTAAELRVRAVGTPPLAYQWFKDGLAIAGVTGPTLTRSNLAMADAGEYRVRVTNHLGQDISVPASLGLLASDGIPLAEALDMPGFEFATGGSVAWVGQACETHDGMDAAALRDVSPGARGELSTRVAGPGRLTFWWRADADFFDSLWVEIGGRRFGEIRGAGAWRLASIEVPAGVQTLRWIFDRPSYSSGPVRAAFLDEVGWTPYDAPPSIASGEPANASPCAGETAVLAASVSGWPTPDLRWFLNGSRIEGQTGDALILTNLSAADVGQYQLVASNRFGAVTSRVAVVALRACVSLPEALDAPDLPWTTGGDAPWFGQRAFSRDARHAAQSGPIGHNQESWLETVVEGPGTLFFSWRAGSEACCDLLELFVDGVYQRSAAQGWEDRRWPIASGQHTVRWRYRKDGSVSLGADAGWLDLVRLERTLAAPEIVTQPVSIPGVLGGGAAFRVVASGFPAPEFQWLRDGVALEGATLPVLELADLTGADFGTYWVVVTNALGVAVSDPARLVRGGTLTGLVSDATNDRPVPGARVRAGDLTTITDTNGNYALYDVPAGELVASFRAEKTRVAVGEPVQFRSQSRAWAVRLMADADGYDPWETLLEVPPGSTVVEPITLSPQLLDGIRLVLTWGQNPLDLDAHLRAPTMNGACHEIFHLAGHRGAVSAPPYATLDVDVRSGFGPETITVHRLHEGIYRYFVKHVEGAQALSGSGARVSIYTREGLYQEPIVVPGSGAGAFWHVCDILGPGGIVEVRNQILAADPGSPCLGFTAPAPAGSPAVGVRPTLHGANGALRHRWDFGDGSPASTLVDPVHAYTRRGTYGVTLTVTDPDGRAAMTIRSGYIVVEGSPPVIDPIPEQVLLEDGPEHRVPLGIRHHETAITNLTIQVTAVPQELFSLATVRFEPGASGPVLVLKSAPDQNGLGTMTLVVRDEFNDETGASVLVRILPVNDAPGFQIGPNLDVGSDGQQTRIAGWARSIQAGPPDESAQRLSFLIATDHPDLFSEQPALASDGTLSFTPRQGASGTAVVTVMLQDDGGRAHGGSDSSVPQSFLIRITAARQPPSLGAIGPLSVLEDHPGGPFDMTVSDPDTPLSALRVTATSWNDALLPNAHLRISGQGGIRQLTLIPSPDAFGTAQILVVVDDGEVSVGRVVTVTVHPVNDPPVAGDDFARTDQGLALSLLAGDLLANDSHGPANETEDRLSIIGVTDRSDAGGSVSLNGLQIVYRPPPAFSGTDRFRYVLSDGGWTQGLPDPLTATGTVHVVVSKIEVANPPPTVVLTSPLDGSLHGTTLPLRLAALASDINGAVVEVAFYRITDTGETNHMAAAKGSDGSYHAEMSGLAPGRYRWVAWALDNGGAVGWSPVVSMTLADLSGDILILGDPDDPQRGHAARLLAPPGFQVRNPDWSLRTAEVQVLDRSLTHESLLAGFREVIWLAPADRAVSQIEVNALHATWQRGVGLYLIGDALGRLAPGVDLATRNRWEQLTGLRGPGTRVQGGQIERQSPEARDNELFAGLWGTVADFMHSGSLEVGEWAGDGEVRARLRGQPVLVRYPGFEQFENPFEGRRVVQHLRVPFEGVEPSVSDEPAHVLFRNATQWILGGECENFAANLSCITPLGQPPCRPFPLVALIENNGRCAAGGVVVTNDLTPGLEIVGARVRYESGEDAPGVILRRDSQVVFGLGQLNAGARLILETWVAARAGGPQTCTWSRQANYRALERCTVPVEILGADCECPSLSWEASALVIRGTCAVATVLEVSTDLGQWTPIRSFAPGSAPVRHSIDALSGGGARFYRLRIQSAVE